MGSDNTKHIRCSTCGTITEEQTDQRIIQLQKKLAAVTCELAEANKRLAFGQPRALYKDGVRTAVIYNWTTFKAIMEDEGAR